MRRFWNMLSAVCCFDCVTCDRRAGERVRKTWASTDQVSQAAVIFEVSVYMPMVVQKKKSPGLGLLTQSCIWPVFHFRPHAKISPLLSVGCSLSVCTRPCRRRYMSRQEGPKPGESFLSVPRLALFTVLMGCCQLLDVDSVRFELFHSNCFYF